MVFHHKLNNYSLPPLAHPSYMSSHSLHCPNITQLLVTQYHKLQIFSCACAFRTSRDSSVGVVTGYGQDGRWVGVRVSVGARIFSSPRLPDRSWGPSSLLSNGYRRLFPPGVKRPGRQADRSPPTSAEVKNMWIYTSAAPYAFMA
jgi:hypothetical protein